MDLPSLDALQERLQRWMEQNSKLTGRFLAGSLVGLLGVVGLLFALLVVLLVSFVWGMSREAAILMGMLTVLFWLLAVALLFSLRNRDHAYSRKLKEWIRKAEEGDARSQWLLVEAYGLGKDSARRDPAACAWWLRQLAEAGDPKAMVYLAQMLKAGDGVLRDRIQAKVWLDRATEAGQAEALRLRREWFPPEEGRPE